MHLDAIVNQTLKTSKEMQKTLFETSQQAQTVSKAAQVSMDVSVTGQNAVSTDQQTDAMDQLVLAVNSIKETSIQTSTSFREVGL